MGSPIFRGGGSQKNNIYGELPKKGLGQFAEGLVKNKEEGAFEGGGDSDIYIYLDAQ